VNDGPAQYPCEKWKKSCKVVMHAGNRTHLAIAAWFKSFFVLVRQDRVQDLNKEVFWIWIWIWIREFAKQTAQMGVEVQE
jgi:hypothetical protein